MEGFSILLVDDDKVLSTVLKEFLETKGYRADLRHDAASGLSLFREGNYDLCVLDVKMPLKDGFVLSEELRAIDSEVPIIFLTGESEKERRIEGLKLGADDYVIKPFSMEELELRIVNVLRRVNKKKEISKFMEPRGIGLYHFDPVSRILQIENKTIRLSATESQLLQMFCTSPEGQINRSEALTKIWKDEAQLHGRSLNVYVSKLRKYLAEDVNLEILNVHGSGYRLVIKA
ncbi:MAG: response regulator transcription factor [Saprospiraceae bacterium]